jgi:hypothetical protein
LASRDSNDPRIKSHYKMYCKILSEVFKEAKQDNYNSQILKSNNKIKTTWGIVKVESGKKTVNNDAQSLNIEGKSINNPQTIASAFNEHFLSLVEKTYSNNNNNNINPIYYLSRAFSNSFPNINFKFSTTKEIENIIKSLKLKNSHGYDEISSKILCSGSPSLVQRVVTITIYKV